MSLPKLLYQIRTSHLAVTEVLLSDNFYLFSRYFGCYACSYSRALILSSACTFRDERLRPEGKGRAAGTIRPAADPSCSFLLRSRATEKCAGTSQSVLQSFFSWM